MARPKKNVQNQASEADQVLLEPENNENEEGVLKVQVIDNRKTAQSKTTEPAEPHAHVFRRGGVGSVETHLVIIDGIHKWLTKNAIEIILKSRPGSIVFPEGSLYNVAVKNVPCKNCGK